jgi:hypothetical protein
VFAPFRNAVADLVGYLGRHRDHPVLGSVGAYEVAYQRLYDAVAGLLPKPSVDVPYTGEAAAPCPQSRQAPTAGEEEPVLGGFAVIH